MLDADLPLLAPTGAGHPASSDWDEVNEFCRRVYMPYRVRTSGRLIRPNATLQRAEVARIKVTRFAYGVPVQLDRFDPEAGNILVLTTLNGALRHKETESRSAETGVGDSFVVDCSRTDYWLEADPDHLQLNLTIPHDVIAETAHRWFGFVPDDRLWTRRTGFGGAGSRWHALLGYLTQTIRTGGALGAEAPLARHLEEMLCIDLLHNWAERAGVALQDGARAAAPHYVRKAELLMDSLAQEAPTIGEVARQVGVSARTLSEGFQRFRGISPRDFLRDRRLDGLNAALLAAAPEETVTSIASAWGYANFGAMAGRYRARFGELPSATLARATGRK
jgi:AraC-like DNA-binding protein